MTADKRSMLLGTLTGASFTLNSIIHTFGYTSVTNMAGSDTELRAVLAVLWLSFTAGLVALGLITFVFARSSRPSRARPPR